VFETWAEILNRVPGSKLIIGHIESNVEGALRKLFADRGVDAGRLQFRPRAPLDKYVAQHLEVDMLLDTFPYNGGTTTCYGLWMGVPTLTLAGRSVPARTGAAILGSMGLPEFIAESREDYVAKAVQWATQLDS